MLNQNLNPTELLTKFPKIKPLGLTSLAGITIMVVVAGLASGLLLSGAVSGGSGDNSSLTTNISSSTNEAGVKDVSGLDTASGKLFEGGISGEGTHRLERAGGPSQTVYLTSTSVDLSSFIDKNVQIWGLTMSSKKAGWLMDVSKIKVL